MSAGPPHAPRVRNKQTTIPSINIQIIVYIEAGGSRHFSKLSSFMRAMKLEALSCGKIVLSAGDVSETEWRTAQVDRHTSRRVMARLAHSFLFRCTPRHYLSPRRSLGEDDDSVSRGGAGVSGLCLVCDICHCGPLYSRARAGLALLLWVQLAMSAASLL